MADAEQVRDGIPAANAGLARFGRALRVCFNLLVIFMVGAVFFFLWKSFFVVKEHEAGIILRFGKILVKDGKQTLDKGLHFSLPYPIDERIRVEAKRQHTVKSDFFWYSEDALAEIAGGQAVPEALEPGVHGYTLTGDMNIIHSKWTLQYNITAPVAYAMRFYNGATKKNQLEDYLKLLLHSAVTQASASLPIDTAWNNRDEKFRLAVEEILKRRIADLSLGLELDRVFLVTAPPRQVKADFDSVTQAEEERRKLVSQALGEAQTQEAEAKVAEAQIVAEANSYKVRIANKARADAENFKKLYPKYKKNPEVFKRIYYEEKLRRILSQVEEKFVIDKRKQRQIRIELNPDPGKAKRGTDTGK